MYVLKECKKCNEYKLLDQFVKSTQCIFERTNVCKECNSNYKKQYATQNKDAIKIKQRNKYIENKELRKEKGKKYYERNKFEILKRQKIYAIKNSEKIKFRQKEYRQKNKEKLSLLNKEYKNKNYEHIKKVNDLYYLNNKERIENYRNEYRKNKRKLDPVFNLQMRIRTRLYIALKRNGFSKKSKMIDIIGCSFEFLKVHLENKFSRGMTWHNMGYWHIDHIIPYASAKTEEDIIKLSHYTNLQPMWANENLKKGSNIIK